MGGANLKKVKIVPHLERLLDFSPLIGPSAATDWRTVGRKSVALPWLPMPSGGGCTAEFEKICHATGLFAAEGDFSDTFLPISGKFRTLFQYWNAPPAVGRTRAGLPSISAGADDLLRKTHRHS